MKIVVLDITGRNAKQYNPSLCSALADNLRDGTVTLMAPGLYKEPEGFEFKKLIHLVPKKWSGSEARSKRMLRAFESILNYIYLIIYVAIARPDILHIQWLPFIEFMSMEKHFLSILHVVNHKMKILLTAHNIFPHNLSDDAKERYRKRFKALDNVLDGYMVHLHSSKQELSDEFGIDKNKIFVAYHGIYIPEGYSPRKDKEVKPYKRIVLFGIQNRYKGADILMKSLMLLPQTIMDRLHVRIMGRTDADLYNEYKDTAKAYHVEWTNKFIPDQELYEAIGECDLILLPYLKISQSGVLLLALSYKKPILTSDLPSFRETLDGYPEDYFFTPNSPVALAEMLTRYVNEEIDGKVITETIQSLNEKYSWDESAKSTLAAYEIIRSR